jgi:heme-degrading monooxygenase HmoA
MKHTISALLLGLLGLLAACALAAESPAPTDASTYLASPNASASPRASHMIARIWHGKTLASKADSYLKYLNDTGVAKMLKLPGNLGVEVLRRNQGGTADFVVISYWTSIDAVKGWAGADYGKTRFLDRDREFLIDPEPEVVHYEVVRSGAR